MITLDAFLFMGY